MAVVRDLVIRIAGEAGEGVLSTGQLVTQAAARGGFHVLTFYSPPAEIKGGHALFQIRLSGQRVYSQGDALDILLAFNQEAYDRNIAELRPGGLLIFDPAECTPSENGDRIQVSVPLTDIAKNQLRFELGKNVVAVGVVAALFGLPTEHLTRLLREKWGRKGEEVLAKNFQALEAGLRYVEEHIPEREKFRLEAGPVRSDIIVVSGNQALALGALAAGCRFFAGYPITPASDIMEFLAEELPKVGGVCVQAEDEIASINMVLGAAYAGKKAMTATSGPGFSLMVEGLGLGTMAELPCVVVDAQRAGPSTGMPTRHEQGDLYLAAFGGHGEVPRLVLAPTSVEDCFYQAVNAFNLAEKYQVPVILLSYSVVAVRTESIPRPDLNRITVINRRLFEPNGHADGYLRYAPTDDGVSPMSLPGQPGGEYVATGLEHNETGRPRYDPATHRRMTEKRFRKIERAAADAPPADRYGDPTAEIGIVTWGSTAGVVVEAIDRARERGIRAEMVAPKLLRPLPDHQLADFMRSKRVILVPEVNYSGQFADLLTARYRREVIPVRVYAGQPFKVAEILQALEEVAQHVG